MEGQPAKQAEVVTPKPLEFEVGNFNVKAFMEGRKIHVSAYSDMSGRMFEGTVEDKDLSELEQGLFKDYEGVYTMMEDCLIGKRNIRLSDVGELTFPYIFQLGKNKLDRTFDIKLKEVEVDETQRLLMKVDRLESEVLRLKNLLDVPNRRLEEELLKHATETKKLEEELQKQKTVFQEELLKQKTLFQEELLQLRTLLQQQTAQLRLLEESKLNKPPELEFRKVVPELDTTTTSIAKVAVNGTQLSANKNIGEYHPFFLTHRLQGREAFEVEITAVGSLYYIFIGVAADTLRNVANAYSNADSLTLWFHSANTTYLQFEATQINISAVTPFTPKNGYRILVRVDRTAQEVEWSISHPVVHKLYRAPIPTGMRDKTLLPVLHLYCNCNQVVKFV